MPNRIGVQLPATKLRFKAEDHKGLDGCPLSSQAIHHLTDMAEPDVDAGKQTPPDWVTRAGGRGPPQRAFSKRDPPVREIAAGPAGARELIYPLSLAVDLSLTAEQLATAFTFYPSLSGPLAEAARVLGLSES